MPVARFQMPDGRVARFEVPDGTTPEQAHSLISQELSQAPVSTPSPQPEVGAERTALEQGLQGATFGFADEITDRIGSGLASLATGETYSDLLKEARGASKDRMAAQFEQRPGLSLASNLAGGLLTGVAGASTKAGTALTNSLRTGGAAARIGKGAVAGAASGAAYGAGTSDEGKRLAGAGQGAAIGGAFGAAVPAIGAAYRGVKNTASGARNIALPGNPAINAEQKVLQRFSDDLLTPQGISGRLSNRPGAAIIDVGRANTQRLGEAVSNIPGKSANIAEGFVEGRASGASKRIKGDISRYISNRGELSTVADDLMKKGEELASPLYEKAFSANKDIASPIVNRILKTDAGRKALAFAANRMNNKMALMGVPDKELAEQAKLARKYSTGGISKGLKLRTLDFVKQGLDDQASALYRAGESGAANDIRDLARGLRNELDNLDVSGGLYKQARKVWSGTMQGQEALENGRSFLNFDTPALRNTYRELGDTEKELFRVGIAQHIRDLVNKSPDRTNIAKRIFGKQEYREKLQSILGKDEFNKFRLSMMREDKMHLLNQKLVGNSRTLLRQQEISDLGGDSSDILVKALTGNKTVMAINQLGKMISARYQGINRQTATEIANILFERDPQKQAQIILRLQQRAAANNKPAAKAYLVLKGITRTPEKSIPGVLSGNLAGQIEGQP